MQCRCVPQPKTVSSSHAAQMIEAALSDNQGRDLRNVEGLLVCPYDFLVDRLLPLVFQALNGSGQTLA